MSKKFTFLIIPEDDSETRSYSFNKTFLNILLGFSFLIFLAVVILSVLFGPKVLEYENLNKKYKTLARERVKVLELANSLEKLIHMDDFVRN